MEETNRKYQRRKRRAKLRTKLRNKYMLSIMNEKNFEPVFSFRLSIFNVFVSISILSIIFILIVYVIIAYTPLKEYIIPNYPVAEERDKIIHSAEMVDSLERQMNLYGQKMQILQTILNGENPSNYENIDSLVVAQTEDYKNLNFDISPADSMLRMEIQENEAFNVNFQKSQAGIRIQNQFFYAPIYGVVSSNFSNGHCGTDIMANENSIIHSVLDGTVIFDTWTVESGYTIVIQHNNDFLSIYKNNEKLLKKTGDHVSAGEGIALLGNIESHSKGPHLHFELWHEGKPVNSENYIVF